MTKRYVIQKDRMYRLLAAKTRDSLKRKKHLSRLESIREDKTEDKEMQSAEVITETPLENSEILLDINGRVIIKESTGTSSSKER